MAYYQQRGYQLQEKQNFIRLKPSVGQPLVPIQLVEMKKTFKISKKVCGHGGLKQIKNFHCLKVL